MARSASDTVRGVQTILRVSDFPRLTIDGIVGPKTVAAFKSSTGSLRRLIEDFTAKRGFDANLLFAPIKRVDTVSTAPSRAAAPVTPSTPVRTAARAAANLTPQMKFVRDALPSALQAQAETGLSASLAIAQAAHESGWGTSGLAQRAKNFFGVKTHGSQWSGPVIDMRTREVRDGKSGMENAAWRVYNSFGESVKGWVDFLKRNGRYARAGLFSTGVIGFPLREVEALAKAGYATDPQYATKVKDILSGRTMRQGLAAAGYELDKDFRITKIV